MAVFRLQENVPDVYTRKSRDFQLLCNVFDCVNNGVKYDIDSIVDILDTRKCNERLLPLLQTKLGFFSNKNFTASQLRAVLTSFKQIVKDKGSEIGIKEAIEVFLKISNASNKSEIRQINKDLSVSEESVKTRLTNNYLIDVAIESGTLDVTILTELLKYVLPAGYRLQYSFYSSFDNVSVVNEDDVLNIIFLSSVGDDGTSIGNNQVTARGDEDSFYGYTGVNGVSTSRSVTKDTKFNDIPSFVHAFDKRRSIEENDEQPEDMEENVDE